MSRLRLVIVDDSDSFRRSLARALDREFAVDTAGTVHDAMRLLSPPPAAVLLDLRLDEADTEHTDALNLLRSLRGDFPHVPVIMITAHGDVETAVKCMHMGAADFLEKGGDIRELRARIAKAVGAARAASRLQELEREIRLIEPREIVGASTAIQKIKELMAGVARDGQVTALITGETGTGKELVARAIHASGPRADRPFVPVSIVALPGSTLESELFGHEPGAFTDAKQRRIGLFEQAHSGVLLLDEIAELDPGMQVKLLRFLEERVITRLGGRGEIAVDIQVIAATNANLGEATRQGRFRGDLYYRLKVCEIHIPPLRERRDDIVLLVEHFLGRFGRARGVKGVTPQAMNILVEYEWPGNIRELRNTVEAAVLRASLRHDASASEDDLPESLQITKPRSHPNGGEERFTLDEALAHTELAQVERALRESRRKKNEAWKLLGLNDRFTFARRVRRLCERFPEMLPDYPVVREAFGPQLENEEHGRPSAAR